MSPIPFPPATPMSGRPRRSPSGKLLRAGWWRLLSRGMDRGDRPGRLAAGPTGGGPRGGGGDEFELGLREDQGEHARGIGRGGLKVSCGRRASGGIATFTYPPLDNISRLEGFGAGEDARDRLRGRCSRGVELRLPDRPGDGSLGTGPRLARELREGSDVGHRP